MNSTQNIKVLLAGVVIVIVAGLGVLYLTPQKEQSFGSFNPTGGGTYLLQSSISSTQTTITLTSFTEPGSGIPYTMAYINTNIVYGTLSPSSGNSEFVSFTGITQNANGTATLTGVTRGQSRSPGSGGCVASTTLARAYPGQTQFILSNSPCFYSQFATKQNDQSISGIWNFDIYPVASSTLGNATTSQQFITFGQAQSLASQGAATGTESVAGIVRLGTALQAASSTYLGVNIPLVLQTKYATDTPQLCTVGSPCVPVTAPNGFLRSTFIDKTATYLWTALHTFSAGLLSTASSTFSATTTIAASSVTNNAFILDGLAYKWPALRGASSTVLTEDGNGTLSFQNPSVVVLAKASNIGTQNSGATSSLATIAIPANSFTTSGSMVKVTALYSHKQNCYADMDVGNGSATTTIGGYGVNPSNPSGPMQVDLVIAATTTTNELAVATNFGANPGPSTSAFTSSSAFLPYNTANTMYVAVSASCTSGGPITLWSYVATLYR